MYTSKRAVQIWSMVSLGLLLGALMVFLVVVVTFSTTYGLPIALPLTSDSEVDSLLLAALLVAASALVTLGAVAAGTRGLDTRTRAVRRRSIDALSCLLAIFLVSLPAFLVSFKGNKVPGGECAYDYTTCSGRPLIFGLGVFFLAVVPLLITYVIFAIGAVSAGISRAAKSGKRGWFVAILVYLIGSLVITVAVVLALAQKLTSDPNGQLALSLFILSPFLTPVVTLLYSFVDREQSKST